MKSVVNFNWKWGDIEIAKWKHENYRDIGPYAGEKTGPKYCDQQHTLQSWGLKKICHRKTTCTKPSEMPTGKNVERREVIKGKWVRATWEMGGKLVTGIKTEDFHKSKAVSILKRRSIFLKCLVTK